jgi:hypothetical protein
MEVKIYRTKTIFSSVEHYPLGYYFGDVLIMHADRAKDLVVMLDINLHFIFMLTIYTLTN